MRQYRVWFVAGIPAQIFATFWSGTGGLRGMLWIRQQDYDDKRMLTDVVTSQQVRVYLC